MILPSNFIQNVVNSNGNRGRQYLADLPALLEEASCRWDLTLGEPFQLSYNYVCAVTRSDGSPGVLKIGVPNAELTCEINALNIYKGNGACHLLESDSDKGMLLLERLQPGILLSTLDDDDLATEIAAKVVKAIHRPLPEGIEFIRLRDWFDQLKKLRILFDGGTGNFPERTITLVEELVRDLFAEKSPHVLLHGDFHHFNILNSNRGWLVIDPKGVDGIAEYEVGPFLLNPWGLIPTEKEAIRRTQRRVAIFSERLGFDRQRMVRWSVCHSFLSAWWDTKKDGSGGEYSLAWTEIFQKMLK